MLANSSNFHNDHNVYILGAGFSAHDGYPLIPNFMNVMKDSLDWLQKNQRTEEIKAIELALQFQQILRPASDRICVDVENIEELFSLAFSKIQGPSDTFRNSLAISIAATLDFAKNNNPTENCSITLGNMGEYPEPPQGFRQAPDKRYEGDLYDFFLGVMAGNRKKDWSRKDTIITFNYDLLAEEALTNLGIPCVYGGLHGAFLANFHSTRYHPDAPESPGVPDPLPEHHVRVIKLHGSVNWMLNPEFDPQINSGAAQYRVIVLDDYQSTWTYQQAYENNRKSKGGFPPTLLLAPPIWSKDLRDLNAPLSNVWNAAVRAIETATRIIVIGYSMPQTDPYFKYLLAAGLSENISLRKLFFINPILSLQVLPGKENAPEEMKTRLFNVIRKHFQEQDRLVLSDRTTFSFFADPENRKRINRNYEGAFKNQIVSPLLQPF